MVFFALPCVVQGPGQAGESGIQCKLSMDCSNLYPQIKPRSANTNLTLHKWVRGDLLKHQEFPCALVISWPGKLMWKEISGRKALVDAACCWRHWWQCIRAPAPPWAGLVRGCCFANLGSKSGFPISFAFPLSLWCLSTGSENCQNSGGKGVSFFAIFEFLKHLLHHAGGRERKYN